MHGRPRLPVGQSPDRSNDEGKARKLNSLLAEVLKNHHERCYTKEALKQNAQLLEINPEVYTAWNYRKLAVKHLLDLEPDGSARKLLLEDELRLVERALRVNVKSYGAWFHRKWVIDFGLSSVDHEFLLLKKLLKDDSRNFHGWAYRRFAVRANNVSAEEELEYATEKINENFSNYSAWHYRSTLLSQLVKGDVSKEEILTNEFELVNQAYFTEPDDQSAWFYNSWLLGETKMDSRDHILGTWPLNGSTVLANVNKQSGSVFVTSKNPLEKECAFYSKGIPLILSFSKPTADIVAQVTILPELGHLPEMCWRPLSTSQGRSEIWVGEFPIDECENSEYAVSLRISAAGGAVEEIDVKFKLQVTSGVISKEGNGSPAKRTSNDVLFWPGEISFDEGKEERRHKLEQEGTTLPSVSEGELEATPDVMLGKKTAASPVCKIDWRKQVLEEQIKHLRELLELEENSKWAKLTLTRVLLAHSAHTHDYGQYTDEVLSFLKELTQIDPGHRDYYKSLLSSIFIAKVLRSPNSLKQLWWASDTAVDGPVETVGWLRWNGLSLSKFDWFEKLLWVQRLDLSDNQLRSIDGLEAMQLLVALDLSHNLIPSVSSLSPIRLLPQLMFLNVSHNEIGRHPVDSARYSFPSLLTNQMKLLHQKDEDLCEDMWEVQAVFGGMDLRVVEIAGNDVANSQKFRETLAKVLPSLKLLDGKTFNEKL